MVLLDIEITPCQHIESIAALGARAAEMCKRHGSYGTQVHPSGAGGDMSALNQWAKA